MDTLSADSLILIFEIFSEHSLPKRILSDAGDNFVSETFSEFLEEPDHRAGSVIIIPPPEQWTSGSMH